MATTHTTQEVEPQALSPVERVVAWALPSLGDMLFVLCLLGVTFTLQGRALGQDGDIGWHIRLGLRTLAGDFPRTDTFSSTAYGRPLVGMEWLAEVCFAAAWRVGGLNAVVTLAGLLIGVTAAGLLYALRTRGVPVLLALPLSLVALALTSMHWVARPHLFSFPLTLWWSEWLWRYWRDGRTRRLWYFPPVMLLWVNLHGGFLSGLILLGTSLIVALLFPRNHGRADPRALGVTFTICLAATVVTPWGAAWVPYFASYFRDPLVLTYTQELQSPDFHTLGPRLFLALMLLLALAWVYTGRRSLASRLPEVAAGRVGGEQGLGGAPEPLAVATACVWTILALDAVRAVPLWALVVTPLLGEALTRWLGELSDGDAPVRAPRAARAARWLATRSKRLEVTERLMGRGVWAGLAVVLIAAIVLDGGRLPGRPQPLLDVQFSARDFPVAAASQLRRTGLPPGRGFNTIEWGGYLTYALPQYHVFIDSRSDFYGQAMLRDYLTILDASPGWQHTLDRYGVRWALMPPTVPLASVLALDRAWSCSAMGHDGVAVLCVRSS